MLTRHWLKPWQALVLVGLLIVTTWYAIIQVQRRQAAELQAAEYSRTLVQVRAQLAARDSAERVKLDSATRQLEASQGELADALFRWQEALRTAGVRPGTTFTRPSPRPPGDTTPAPGPDVDSLLQAGNELAQACTQFQQDCQAYRQQAERTIEQQRERIGVLEAIADIKTPVPPAQRRWGLGAHLGYGVMAPLSGLTGSKPLTLEHGPTVSVGLTLRF